MNLHGGAPFWLLRNALAEARDAVPTVADVVVIGAGITGALIADRLVRDGHDVLVLDRHSIAEGSTAASTALLMYGLDVELGALGEKLGSSDAARAYRRVARAVTALAELADGLDASVDLRRSTCLYLASRRGHAKRLQEETRLRDAAGLDAAWLDAPRLRAEHGLVAHGAIRAGGAADVDPVRLARALLARAQTGGGSVVSRVDVTGFREHPDGVTVETSRGEVRANWCVAAMGYATPPGLTPHEVALHSSYALVSEPLESMEPLGERTMFWESERPYLYARSTADRRLIVGGADLPFRDPDARDAALPARRARLERQVRKRLPDLTFEVSEAWCGTFAETPDGLPVIGPIADAPRVLLALCAGGNGIPFAQIAADLVAAHCRGEPDPEAGLFGASRG